MAGLKMPRDAALSPQGAPAEMSEPLSIIYRETPTIRRHAMLAAGFIEDIMPKVALSAVETSRPSYSLMSVCATMRGA